MIKWEWPLIFAIFQNWEWALVVCSCVKNFIIIFFSKCDLNDRSAVMIDYYKNVIKNMLNYYKTCKYGIEEKQTFKETRFFVEILEKYENSYPEHTFGFYRSLGSPKWWWPWFEAFKLKEWLNIKRNIVVTNTEVCEDVKMQYNQFLKFEAGADLYNGLERFFGSIFCDNFPSWKKTILLSNTNPQIGVTWFFLKCGEMKWNTWEWTSKNSYHFSQKMMTKKFVKFMGKVVRVLWCPLFL